MKKSLALFLSLILFNTIFAQKSKKRSSFDTSRIVGFICADSNCNNVKSFRGYVVIYDPSDSELDGYRNGSKVKVKKMPDEVILDESKHKLLYQVITWYFVTWKHDEQIIY